jgi:cAMP-dependent protein kinase regulator
LGEKRFTVLNMKELTRLVFAKPFGFGKKSLSPLPDRSRPSQAISPDDRQFVTFAVTGHSDFVLSNLDGKDVDMLVDAMESFEVSSGDNVIEQGDMGDFLYVVKEGSLRCRKDGAEIGIIGPGEVFGELALLYDCPRSASVVADSDCMLFRVSREIFRRIQATFILANDDNARRFLKRTKLLGDLPDDVIREMANCLFKKEFQKGDMLTKKGDYFEEVYFLKQGRLLARNISLEESEFADVELKVGECFGERAIVMKQPSIANVECLTDGVAFVLTKERFLHCLQGMDLEDIIEKEVDAKVMVRSLGDRILGAISFFMAVPYSYSPLHSFFPFFNSYFIHKIHFRALLIV